MNWTTYFDKIYLINLPHRTDRLAKSTDQLHQYQIPFELVPATHHVNGANGIYLTLVQLFKHCIKFGFKNVLVFEDDLDIICPEINQIMPLALEQLPADYLELRLGANIPQPNFATRYSENLFLVSRMLSLHAVAYSLECMEAICAVPKKVPIDMMITEWLHPMKRSFCTYPMLVSQRNGHSDIENKVLSWKPFLEGRFEKVVEHLKIIA